MSRSIAPHADPTAAPRAEKSAPLRLLLSAESAAAPRLTLPTFATAGDVREAVQYLKKKPAGVSVAEAMDDVKRRVFEPRKVAAYEFWGVVTRRHDRLHLSPLGWEFARKLEPEAEAYRALLDRAAPYRAALEWMHRERLELVTHGDVAAFWQRAYGDALDADGRPTEANVVCFFHLCQAAELGTVTIGKRGQPARLRVEREELALHVSAERPEAADPEETEDDAREPANESREALPLVASSRLAGAPPRVFVSAGRESKLLGRVRTALELADIECRVSFREAAQTGPTPSAGAWPVPEELFRAMRQCEAAIVVVSREDLAPGEAGLSQALLVQIASAFVIYERRVALLWAADVPVPANLRELPRVAFEGDELTWEAGVGMLRAVRDFQARARRVA